MIMCNVKVTLKVIHTWNYWNSFIQKVLAVWNGILIDATLHKFATTTLERNTFRPHNEWIEPPIWPVQKQRMAEDSFSRVGGRTGARGRGDCLDSFRRHASGTNPIDLAVFMELHFQPPYFHLMPIPGPAGGCLVAYTEDWRHIMTYCCEKRIQVLFPTLSSTCILARESTFSSGKDQAGRLGH